MNVHAGLLPAIDLPAHQDLKQLDEEGSLIPKKWAPGSPPKLDGSAMRLLWKTSMGTLGLPIHRSELLFEHCGYCASDQSL